LIGRFHRRLTQSCELLADAVWRYPRSRLSLLRLVNVGIVKLVLGLDCCPRRIYERSRPDEIREQLQQVVAVIRPYAQSRSMKAGVTLINPHQRIQLTPVANRIGDATKLVCGPD